MTNRCQRRQRSIQSIQYRVAIDQSTDGLPLNGVNSINDEGDVELIELITTLHTYLSYKYNPAIGYQDKPKDKLVLYLLLNPMLYYIPEDSRGNLDEQIRQL
jgi:hypothetical protein